MNARNRISYIRLYDRLKENPELARELGVQVSFGKAKESERVGKRH